MEGTVADLFKGPLSLTYPRERLAFWLTLIFALPAAGAIGFVIHEEIGISQVALFLVIAMVYVTLARGRLVGSSVRITPQQYPHIFEITQRCAAALDLPMPLVFVREDNVTPVLAVGFGEPYSLVLSSHWIEHFKDDELTFMIGRTLGHIAAGHTRYTSLLSVNGSENPIISLIFGAWLRKVELTCDRVGLLCCGSVDAAIRAISVGSFHLFGRKIDHTAFADQAREIGHDHVFRLGEWIGSEPYATTRATAMRAFAVSNLYRIHEDRMIHQSAEQPVNLRAADASAKVEKADCAGLWRRGAALLLDVIVISAILQTAFFSAKGAPSAAPPPVSAAAQHASSASGITVNESGVHVGSIFIPLNGNSGFYGIDFGSVATAWYAMPYWYALFAVLLIALVGQTPGMLVAGLRVVRADFSRVRPGQSIGRYVILAVLWPLIVLFVPFTRVYLHDRLSGTRLIRSERALARTQTA